MQVDFRGTRGSAPIVASTAMGSFRSYHSPCVQIVGEGGGSLLLDAGSALGPTMREARAKGQDTFSVLLTHFHWDHITGFLTFYDLFFEGIKIKIISPFEGAQEHIATLFRDIYCPIDNSVVMKSFEFMHIKDEVSIQGIKARFFEVPHSGKTYGIEVSERGRRAVFLPDVDLAEMRATPIANGPDLLICDSFHLREDKARKGSWGHSTAIEAVAFGLKVHAKRLALFHYSPTYYEGDIRRLVTEANSVLVPEAMDLIVSQDGLVVTL